MQTASTPAQTPAQASSVRVDTSPRRAESDTIVPVTTRCAWCRGWMNAPQRPDRMPISHGICPGCRDHGSRHAAQP
jgi:hypothetical protein